MEELAADDVPRGGPPGVHRRIKSSLGGSFGGGSGELVAAERGGQPPSPLAAQPLRGGRRVSCVAWLLLTAIAATASATRWLLPLLTPPSLEAGGGRRAQAIPVTMDDTCGAAVNLACGAGAHGRGGGARRAALTRPHRHAPPLPPGYCCSQYGWCGKTAAYCGAGCVGAPYGVCSTSVSLTATRTASVSPTAKRTASVSPTATPTASVSPTATPTASVSPTRTGSRSVTSSPTPLASPGTPTVTAAGAPTLSGTPSTSALASPTRSPTSTGTRSPTATPSPTPSSSRTKSASASAGLPSSATPSPVMGPGAAFPAGMIISSCTVPGTVALTFDDGPLAYTTTILDVLKQYGGRRRAPATWCARTGTPPDHPPARRSSRHVPGERQQLWVHLRHRQGRAHAARDRRGPPSRVALVEPPRAREGRRSARDDPAPHPLPRRTSRPSPPRKWRSRSASSTRPS